MFVILSGLISLIIIRNRGFYDPQAFGLLVLVAVAAVRSLLRRTPAPLPSFHVSAAAASAFPVISLLFPKLLYASDMTWDPMYRWMLAVAAAIPVLHLAEGRQPKRWMATCAVAALAAAQLSVIGMSPHPDIDVFRLQQKATAGISRGIDPYRITDMTTKPVPGTSRYTYFPGTFLTTYPIAAVTGDVRVAMVALIALSSVLFIWLGTSADMFLPMALSSIPITPFVIEQSFTEPVVILWLTVMILAIRHKRFRLSAIAAGMLLSTKHYAFLGLPFVAAGLPFTARWTWLAVALGTFAATCVPFFAWDPEAFRYNLLGYFLSLPDRTDGMSLYSFTHAMRLPYTTLIPWTATVLLSVWGVRAVRMGRALPMQCLGVTLLIFFLLNTIAFPNYFYIVIWIMLASSSGQAMPSAGDCAVPAADRTQHRRSHPATRHGGLS